MKRNSTIDDLKLISAIFVVIIHSTSYISSDGITTFLNFKIYRKVLDLAVPLFFAITGYLYFGKIKSDEHYLTRQCKNVFVSFLSLSIIYLIFEFMHLLIIKCNPLDAFSLSITEIIQGTWASSHLWYLWALFLALLLINHFGFENPLFITFIFLTYMIVLDGKIPTFDYFRFGGFLKAVIFLYIGYHSAKNQTKSSSTLLLIPISFILYYYYTTLSYEKSSVVYMMLFIYSSMISVTKIDGLIKWHFPKNISSKNIAIYYYHMMAISILNEVYPILSIEKHKFPISIIIGVFLVCIISVALAYLLSPLFEVIYKKLHSAVTIDEAINQNSTST